MQDPFQVRAVAAVGPAELEGLCALLVDCVEGGASVGFVSPMTAAKAEALWRGVAAAVRGGKRLLWIAEDAAGVVGTVQVILDQPENQPHRADVAKMLVHRRARRRGLGAALLQAAERGAADAGKTLLVLDTASADAERLYERGGWQAVGVIPGYALLPDGKPCDTRVYYKRL